ncbi:MAG: hypothetical protein ABSF18_01960 [Gammaproteobacteria bacterium]|jgi:hypothetical protein
MLPVLKKSLQGSISFLIPAIMVTTGLTNAGFIILLFTGAASLSAVTMGTPLILGIVCAILGAFISGYAQKAIYKDSLEKFVEMIMDGTYLKIARENPGLFWLATFCAACSFSLNLGLGLMGMGVFFASGGAPVIILSLLFALANALLVYYTALYQIHINKNLTLSHIKDFFKKNLISILTVIFGLVASFGLIMLLFPGATEITGKLDQWAKIAFIVLLTFASLTEIFYSWVKSHHLAIIISKAFEKPASIWNNLKDIFIVLINALINSAPGAEGGIELAEQNNIKGTGMHATQATAATATVCWSTTCSADSPPKETLTHQFNRFIRRDVNRPTFDDSRMSHIVSP